MGLATREEIEHMSVDEIGYLNYKARKLYEWQRPESIGEMNEQ